MGVFGDVEGLGGGGVARLLPGPCDGRILAAVHVGDAPVAFVVGWAGAVAGLDGVAHGLEILAGPGFVAVAPDHDRRVVLVALEHRHGARDGRLAPRRAVRERFDAVAVAVRLDVRFVDDVEAARVAEVIPVVVLRVVRVAHGVAVRRLHELDILLVAGLGDVVAEHRVGLAAVGAFEFDRLAVEVVAAVFDFGDAEAEHRRDPLLAVVDDDLVAIRLFRAPEFRGVHGNDAGRRARDKAVVPRIERGLRAALHFDFELPRAAEVSLQNRAGAGEEIAYAVFRPRKEPRPAENAREAEHILVFEIRAV